MIHFSKMGLHGILFLAIDPKSTNVFSMCCTMYMMARHASITQIDKGRKMYELFSGPNLWAMTTYLLTDGMCDTERCSKHGSLSFTWEYRFFGHESPPCARSIILIHDGDRQTHGKAIRIDDKEVKRLLCKVWFYSIFVAMGFGRCVLSSAEDTLNISHHIVGLAYHQKTVNVFGNASDDS